MKRHIFTVSILLVAAQLFGQESRFWVGGSGKWSDTNHWSVTSGGEPGAALPESGTSVVFDENSFSGGRNTVTLNSAVSIGSLTATDADFVFSGKQDFTVSGSINTDANADFGKLRGTLVLSGSGDHTFSVASELEGGIIIDGGSWTLGSNLKTEGDITLKSGSFNTAGHNVTCAVFLATEDAESLNIEESTILCDRWNTVAAEYMTVRADDSEILIRKNMIDNVFVGDRQDYNSIHRNSASKGFVVVATIVEHPLCPSNSDYGTKDNGKVYVEINGGEGLYNILAIRQGADMASIKKPNSNSLVLDKMTAGKWKIGYVNKYTDSDFQGETEVTIGPGIFVGGARGEGIKVTGKARCWGDDIVLSCNATGGTLPYTLSWENPNANTAEGFEKISSADAFPVQLGAAVGLTITDAIGCQIVANGQKPWYYTVDEEDDYKYNGDYNGPELIRATYDIEPTCEGESTGVLTINATGGSEAYTEYVVEGKAPQGTPTFSELAAGTYEVTITDSKGCTNYDYKADFNKLTATITDIPKPTATVDAEESIVCFEDGEYTITDAHAGTTKSSVEPESISWSVKSGTAASIKSGGNTASPVLTLNAPGDVTFTMTVGNGSCQKATVDKTIHVIPVPVPTVVTANNSKICGLSTTIEANKDPLIDGDYSLVAEFVSSDDGTALPPNGLTVTVTNPGTYVFKVKEIVTTAHCAGYSSMVTLKFYNAPSVSLDKSSSSICGLEPVPLKAIIANGDVKWSTADGSGNFGDENSAETYYTPVAADLGKTITLTATVDNDGCDPVFADYTLTVNEVPNPSVPSVPAEVCGKSIDGTAGHSLTGSTITWKSDEGTVTFDPTTGESTTMSVTTEGTYHIYIEESLNGCPKASTSTEVNFRPEPTLDITQGTAGSVCGNESFDLSATTNCNPDNILWDKGAGKGTLSSTTGASTTYTPAADDYGKTITITATVSSDYAICSTPVTKDFALTVKTIAKPEIAQIGNGEGKVCGTTVNASATPKMGGDLTWDWGNDPTLTVSPSTGENVTISGDHGVTYSVRVTETADGCSAVSDDVFFTLYDQPTVSIDDASGDVCGTDEFTATANAENATSLVWTVESGNGTPTVTVIEANKQVKISYIPDALDIDQDVTLKATASDGGVCMDAEETVTFHVYKVPSPSISDLSICGSTDVLTATITAGNTVEWVVPAVVSKSNEEINGTTASVTLTLNEGAEYTSYTVGIIESNANCRSPQVDATVTFVHEPVITVPDLAPQVCAGEEFLVEPDFDYCTSISITASDMGNFAPIPGEYKAKYKAPESTNPTSPVSIWITPSGGCNSDVVTITLTVNPKPQPNLSDVVVCGLSYEVPENTARSVENSLLTWVPATGQSNVHIEGGKYFVSTEEGDKYLTVTESAGMCQTEKTAKITFVAKPEAFAGDDDAVCFNDASYELSAATAANFASLEWRSSSDPGNVFSTELNPTYVITGDDRTNGSVTLTLTAKAKTPCTSVDDVTSSITITINPLPEPEVKGPATACPNDVDPAVYTTEDGMSDYKWYIDGVLQDEATTNTFSHQWTAAGSYAVSVAYTNGNGCTGVSEDYTVTVNTLPVSGLAANAESCTSGSVVLDATVTSGGSGDFSYAWSGTGVNYLDDANIANPTFASDVAGTYALTCTITDNTFGCSIEATVTVDNKQGPSVNAGEDKMVCYGMPVQMVDADTTFCSSVKWTSNGDGSFDDDEKIDAIYTPGDNDKLNANNLNGYTITLTLTASSATCGDVSDDVEITLQPQLQVAVGTVKPFDIQASTKISVKVQGEFDIDFGGAEGLQFFLVSPDREDTLALYEHTMSTANWARWPGTFDFEFTTESDKAPTFKGFPKHGEAKDQFGITGDWSEIYGKNPAEGGWTVMLGGKYTSYGYLKRATIVFSDYEDNDPTKAYKTIKFDSKEKNPGIEIPDGQYLSYISPIGLNVSCRNLCDAHAIAKGIGGAGVYTSFEWSTTPDFEAENIIGSGEMKDLCVGTYYVRVTDAAGCTAMIEVEVGAPDDIHINNDLLSDVTCFGESNGVIEVSAYKENVTNFEFEIEGYTAETFTKDWARFSSLPEGTYDVIVIDEDKCRDTVTYNIGQPVKLEITKIDTTLATSCLVDNGAVTFTVTGGKVEGDYHMEYMGLPQDQPNILIDQNTLTATGLTGASGIKFRIYDANTFNSSNLNEGCYIDTTISTVADGMEFEIATTDNNCADLAEASISVTVLNGSDDYSYEWYDENNNLLTQFTTETASGLSAGSYTVKVTDNNSFCDVTSDPIVISAPEAIKFGVPAFTEQIKCYGDKAATFTVEVSGGTGELSYSWNNGGSTTNGLTNVGAGTYILTVTDSKQCSRDTTIVIEEPDSRLVITNDTVITTPSDCGVPTGSATIAVEGGTGAYSYYWHLALAADSVADDAPVATNLGVGRYIVEVSDKLGCTVSKEFRIQDDGNVEFAWDITKELLCVGNTNGEAEVSSVSGRDEYGRVVTVYDVNLITWENLVTGQTGSGNIITNLGYGTNEIMVIASDGCSSVKNIEIDESNSNVLRVDNPISYPDQFGNGNCDGTIKATITGGVPGYSYIWTNEAGETVDAGTSDSEVTTTITSLCEGEYTLYVEDQNPEGTCTLIETIKVEFSPLSYNVVLHKDVTCYGGDNGELKVTGVDGYPSEEYLYEWTSSQWPADKVVKGDSIGGLTAGWYTISVSQRNNRRVVTDSIQITQPTNRLHIPTTNTVFVDGSHCYDSIGAIQIFEPADLAKVFGGNTPFEYRFSREGWTKDSVEYSGAVPWVTGLPIGDYNLHVSDALGCTFDTVIEVPDLSKFTIKVEKHKDPRCYGDNNGEIKIVASSENGGFTYSWNTGATTDEITKLGEGTYTVKVTDNMNCEKFETIELTQPLKVSFSVSSTVVDCFNSADGGEITVSELQGGWSKYNRFEFFAQNSVRPLIDSIFAPEIEESTVSFNNLLPAGDYKLCVTDVNNCPSDSVQFKVYSARPEIVINNIADDEPTCYNYTADGKLSYGKITVTAIAMVTSQVSSTITDLEQYYQIDGGAVQKAHIFDKVTAGPHTITVGFGDTLLCPVVIEHELGSKSNLRADASFKNDEKLIFACPSDELTAKVKSAAAFSSYKFYALTDEDVENDGTAVEPQPADTTTAPVDSAAIAYRFNRNIRFRDDSVPGADTTGTTVSVDTTTTEPATVSIPEEKKRDYKHGNNIKGENVTLFAEGSESATEAWADKFLPYGGATIYYFEIADNQCVAIDSISAIAMRPTEKLTVTVSMDDATSDELFIGGEYEVPEGGLLTLEANQLQFDNMPVEFVYSENALWTWDWAPADKLNAEGSGLRYTSTNNDNPIEAQSFGKINAKVRDSVTFEVDAEFKDSLYSVSDLGCNYYAQVTINSISGIHPADVLLADSKSKYSKWKIEGLASYDKVTIYVFNRWGGRVWQYSGSGKDYSDAHEWNGRNEKNKPVPSGTYYYVIQCSDGILGGKKVTGPVTVIR